MEKRNTEKPPQERAPITRINASELGFSQAEIDKMFLDLQESPFDFDSYKIALAILEHEGIEYRELKVGDYVYEISDSEGWRVNVDTDGCKIDLSKRQAVLPVTLQKVKLNQREEWINSAPAKEFRVVFKPSGQVLKQVRREYEELMQSDARDKERRKKLEDFIVKNLDRRFTRRDIEAMDEVTRAALLAVPGANIEEYDIFEFKDGGEQWDLFSYKERGGGELAPIDILGIYKLDQKKK